MLENSLTIIISQFDYSVRPVSFDCTDDSCNTFQLEKIPNSNSDSTSTNDKSFIAIQIRLDGKIADFDGTNFINNLANLLKINSTRIIISNIKSGSVIVDFKVLDDPLSNISSESAANTLIQKINNQDPELEHSLGMPVISAIITEKHNLNEENSISESLSVLPHYICNLIILLTLLN